MCGVGDAARINWCAKRVTSVLPFWLGVLQVRDALVQSCVLGSCLLELTSHMLRTAVKTVKGCVRKPARRAHLATHLDPFLKHLDSTLRLCA